MALIAYDVSAKHTDVKAKMKEKGYHDSWTQNGTTYDLPNTTLWKPDATEDTALADIRDVAKSLSVVLQRAVAVPHMPGTAIPGSPHSA